MYGKTPNRPSPHTPRDAHPHDADTGYAGFPIVSCSHCCIPTGYESRLYLHFFRKKVMLSPGLQPAHIVCMPC